MKAKRSSVDSSDGIFKGLADIWFGRDADFIQCIWQTSTFCSSWAMCTQIIAGMPINDAKIARLYFGAFAVQYYMRFTEKSFYLIDVAFEEEHRKSP